jgi:phage I-like protein
VLKQGESSAAAEASEDANATACNAYTDPARFVPMTQFEGVLTELNRERAARCHERAEHMVGGAIRDGRLSPSQRDWAIAYCQADAHGFAKFIANQSPLLAIADRAQSAFSHSRNTAELPGLATRAADRLSAAEMAICSRLGIKPAEYAARKAGAGDFPLFN